MATTTYPKTLVLRSIPVAWYSADTNGSDDPAREAYSNAVKLFNQNLTQDECKRIWLEDKIDLQSVQAAVNSAKEKWEVRTNSKARKWLARFSERVMHYGKVMDTLANYNPEYCALAWGTMKFLLMAVLNHEEYITQLSKSLSQIASALPRINVTILLYPTAQIKHTVSTLYAHLLKFLIRAMKWYNEGKSKHFITAVFRPAPLRFKDLLEEIRTCSETVDQLAVSAGQAEQRNMHVLLQDMYREMMENQAANSRLFLDSKRRTCEIQFSQILTFTATTTLPHPEDSFRYCNFLSRRRQLRATADAGPTWRSHKLKAWAASPTSALIMVKGSCLTRLETKDFATNIVALLRGMKIPVLWTLSAKAENNLGWRSPIEVLKQLVLQVLYVNHSLLNEQSAALNAARFQSAATEADWFDLLGSVLEGLPQVYIVIDAEVMSRQFSSEISWPKAFLELFKKLKARCCETTVKVVLLSFGNSPYLELPPAASHSITIRLDQERRPPMAVRRKAQYRAVARRGGAESLRPILMQAGIKG